MAIDIWDTLYRRKDIRLSSRNAALVLAKMARPDGTVQISYDELARQMNVCKRTAFRVIAFLGKEARIIAKRVRRRVGSHLHEINVYKFLIRFRRHSAHPFSSDKTAKLSSTPIDLGEERKEELRQWREDLRRQEKALAWLCTPGSDAYEQCQADIARLKELIATREGAQP